MSLSVKPLSEIGVEVVGLDIEKGVSEDQAKQLQQLWLDHGVLLFRGQNLSPERQIEFSRIFGTLEMHPLKVKTSAEYPELFVLENGGDADRFQTAFYDGQPIVGRLDWHKDLHYTGKPNRGALLRAVVVAEKDGLTGFGDLAKAYDALDDDLKARIEGLEVSYRFDMQRKRWRFADQRGYEPGPDLPKKPSDVGFPDFPDAIYPMALTHPLSGRRILEIVEQFLFDIPNAADFGLSDADADDLLRQLVAHIRRPEFHYFHRWEEGDMVLWDNWRCMHCTTGTAPDVKRLINRTTIEAEFALGKSAEA